MRNAIYNKMSIKHLGGGKPALRVETIDMGCPSWTEESGMGVVVFGGR